MRHLYLFVFAFVAFVLHNAACFAQISGTTSPLIGTTHTYTYNTGTIVFNPQWRLSLGVGTITNQTQSGTSYSATILWNSTGSETVALLDNTTLKAQLSVNVMSPPPPVPTATAATQVGQLSFFANWNGVSGADSYRIDVSAVSNFASFVTGYNNRTTDPGLSQSVTGLTANTTYYYRVRSASSSGNASANSNVITVTTGPATPSAAAATNISHNSFTANWSTVAGATSYSVDVSAFSNFSSVVTWSSSTGSVSVTGLSGNTTYYYRVRAANSNGVSANSNVISLTTSQPAPIATGPTNIATNSFTANWSGVSGATQYLIDVSPTSNFSSFVTGYNGWPIAALSIGVSGLLPSTTYYYRVRAQNSGWTTGNSNVVSALTLPAPPVAIAGSGIAVSSFTANWNASTGATGYLLDLATDANFTQLVTPYVSYSVTGTAVSLTGLVAGEQYYYRVRALNASGASNNSNSASIRLLPSAPTAAAATAITSSGFTATWSSVYGATGYAIDISPVSNFSSSVTTQTTSSTSYSAGSLTAGTTYYYRVRASNASGQSVNSNTVTVITMPPAPVATSAGAVTTTSFNANWSVTAGASSYLLDVSTDGNFGSFIPGYNGFSLTATSAAVSSLTAGSTYYYRLRAVNASGISGNSNTISIITLPVAPIANAITNIAPTAFTVSWTAVPSASGYRLDVSTVSTFASFVSGYNGLAMVGSSFLVTGLAQGTTYHYRVRAVNASGMSANSTTVSGATLLAPPVAITPTSVSGTSFTARWNASTNATSYRLDVSTKEDFSTFFSTYNNLTVTGTSRVVSGLAAKTTYYYRVRAVNATGTSLNSNVMTGVDLDVNYVRTVDVTVPSKTDWLMVENATINEKTVKHDFFDGLGRGIQSVVQQGSPSLLDIVQPMGYDVFGREVKKYLPYTGESNGWFKPDALRSLNATGTERAQYITGKQYAFYQTGGLLPSDLYPHSEIRFEASPANRPVEQGAPGAAWQPDATNTYTSTDRTVKFSSEVNAANEVLLWTYTYPTPGIPLGLVEAGTAASAVYYSAGQLTRSRTKDEQRNEVLEYKDKHGRVVLKRVQAVSGTPVINDINYTSTYYVYDVFGNLVCVIPPEATSQLATYYFQSGATPETKNSFLARWAFRYTYDASKRMTQKQVPGAAAVYMIYDKRDRLVLTQDGNQRSGTTKYWSFTKYDALNRPILIGMMTSANSRTAMQSAVDNYYANLTASQAWFESYVGSATGNMHGYSNRSFPQVSVANNYLTVTYYDNYDFRSLWTGTYTYMNESLSESVNGVEYTQPAAANLRLTGLVTGSQVKIMDGGILGGSTYLKSISYYDDKGRIIQTISDNQLGGTDRVTNVVDFTGRVLETKTSHTTIIPTSRTVVRNYEYDHAGRLTRTWHKLDAGSAVLISKNDYNELGQLIDKKLHSTVSEATDAKQSVDFLYNIRGWLLKINNSDVSTVASGDDSRDHFGMELGYNATIGTGNTGIFNGNISGMKWSVAQGYGVVKEMAYNFTYDPLNRLQHAASRQNNGTWAAGQYDENNIVYDLNGNIKSLQRKGLGGGTIDNLTYHYGVGTTAGNRLLYVQDNASVAADKVMGFYDGNTGTTTDYTYDSLGNITRDLNKGIGNNITDAANLITYNFMNLPETVTKGGNTVKYIYDATGRKLAQIVTSGAIQNRTDYDGEFVYENNVIQFMNHEEGRVVLTSNKAIIREDGTNTSTMAVSNSNLALYSYNGEKYVQVSMGTPTARAGVLSIGGTINVAPNDRYRIRFKGYRGTNPVFLSVKINGTTDLGWPGTAMPISATTESWMEQIVTVPSGGSTMQVGLTWNTLVTSGDAFYVNEFEITQLLTTAPEYQYHLKDHLGNVRVTFTSKDEIESATATLEAANLSDEATTFLRYDNAKRVQSALFDHTNGSSTGYSQRLNGSTNEKYGLARSISVMPGDRLNIEVYAKYVDTNSANWNAALTSLMSQITSGTAGVVVDGSNYSTSTTSFPFGGLVNTTGSTGGPKAYLNYIIFDRNFNFKTGGYERLSDAPKETGGDVAHERLFFDNLTITEPGYVYIFLSNEETSAVEVFFDDFRVEHIKSPVVSNQDYYPFGLAFNSYSRESSVPNKFLYNGKELQTELNLGVYDYGARMFDPAIGRFQMIDPHSENYANFTPYNYVLDNPINAIDPDGRDAILIAYPDYKIQTPVGKVGGLGHAGVLIIDNKTGVTKYYEYGRYDAENKGIVRNVKISNVKIDKKTGKPTVESLNKVMRQLSKKAGHGGRIRGAYVNSDKFDAMKSYAEGKMAENTDPNRTEYSLNSNNCGTFARDVVSQDEDVDNPTIFNPTPKNIVDEYIEEGNAEVNYDPTKDKTTVGEGDDDDAKKSSSSNKGPTWSQFGTMLNSWLQANPNIQVTIK